MAFVGVLPEQGGEISNETKAYTRISGPGLSKNGLGVDLGKLFFLTFTYNFSVHFFKISKIAMITLVGRWWQGVPIGIVEKLVILSFNSIHTSAFFPCASSFLCGLACHTLPGKFWTL